MRKSRLMLLLGVCLLACGLAAQGESSERPGGAEEWGAQGGQYDRPVVADASLVEVLVEGWPRDLYFARGRRYVEAVRGEEYELRIRNPFPVRVAVALSVDGLNTIDARRTTSWNATKWLIEPYQTITISGWQMSREHARRFYFTNEPDSYASKLGRASDLGVINAIFYRERSTGGGVITRPPYPPPYTPPSSRAQNERERGDERDAPQSRPEGAGKQSARSPSTVAPSDEDYAATGIGRTMRNDVRWLNVDLDPRPAAEVMIRYEYRDALVRLGVLPRPRPNSPDPLRRRERATGFENQPFCPEP